MAEYLVCSYCGARAHCEDAYVYDRLADRICIECLSLFYTDKDERTFNEKMFIRAGLSRALSVIEDTIKETEK
jgi:hypothetical protein